MAMLLALNLETGSSPFMHYVGRLNVTGFEKSGLPRTIINI